MIFNITYSESDIKYLYQIYYYAFQLYRRKRMDKMPKSGCAFAELYELENIVVPDVGRYGFVELAC